MEGSDPAAKAAEGAAKAAEGASDVASAASGAEELSESEVGPEDRLDEGDLSESDRGELGPARG